MNQESNPEYVVGIYNDIFGKLYLDTVWANIIEELDFEALVELCKVYPLLR